MCIRDSACHLHGISCIAILGGYTDFRKGVLEVQLYASGAIAVSYTHLFMLLPQQLEKSEKASEKAYLAVKVNITMQGGKVIHDGCAYIGLNTNWEMGKHYTYTLDFSDGDVYKRQVLDSRNLDTNDVLKYINSIICIHTLTILKGST